MISSRTRSGLYDGTHKTSPARPKSSELSKTSSRPERESSSLQSRRFSFDGVARSLDSRPRSVESKSSNRRSPKISTHERVMKGLEMESQSQLHVVMEELKMMKELLEKSQLEKLKADADLKEAKKEADEAIEKLSEALILQRQAEENLENEKFRAVKLEGATVDAAWMIEQKWQSEIEVVKKKHFDDLSALFSVNQELDRINDELAMATEAKNSVLAHAANAMLIAEENSKKVAVLSDQLFQMREILDETQASQMAVREEKALIDAMWESMTKEQSELASGLSVEVESLKQDLINAKRAEGKLVQTEEMIEKVKLEMDDARVAESRAIDTASVWKKKAELLESEVEKARSSVDVANKSVVHLLKQIDESNTLLQEAEDEIVSLKENLDSLEMSLGKQQSDLKISGMQIEATKLETCSMTKMIESLRKEFEKMEEEKARAYENEKATNLEIQTLMDEKSILSCELQVIRDEEDKSKKAMDVLALALGEISSETKKAKETLDITEDQLAETWSQREGLKSILLMTEEKYQAMIDKTKQESDHYKAISLGDDLEFQSLRADWEAKEFKFMGCIRRSEEEIEILNMESNRLSDSLKVFESQMKMATQETAKLQSSLNQVKAEVTSLKESLEEAIHESHQLKETLYGKENELARAIQVHKDLHASRDTFQEKIKFSRLLAGKFSRETDEDAQSANLDKGVDNSEKMDFADEMSDEQINEKFLMLVSSGDVEMHHRTIASVYIDPDHVLSEKINGSENGKDDDGSVDVEVSTWENCQNSDKGSSTKSNEHTTEEEDFNSKVDCDGLDQMNDLVSEGSGYGANILQKPQHKKKKAIMHKFGGFLKKKSYHK